MASPSTIEACGKDVRIDDQFEVMPKGVNAPITISSVGGIGGEFGIYLPENKDRDLKKVISNVEMEFSVLAGKHAGDSTHIAKIVEIITEEALLEAKISVEKLNNIKITKFIVNGQSHSVDMYGKVIKNVSEEPPIFRINFTSVPQEATALLKSIVQNHT
jgi:adenylate cyclase